MFPEQYALVALSVGAVIAGVVLAVYLVATV
ncbi:hypothetical protein DSM112329_01543 [Paraconexibacter sp. AEG42_29]|uniref:Uncharacterized protein n=1 Tax=Paraconexibacter sp. AEG42_29 TaxID=2997339 RepID=A0AAU7ATA1_9ACTN